MPFYKLSGQATGCSWGSIQGDISRQSDLSYLVANHQHGGYEPANSNIQSHIADRNNPHQVIKVFHIPLQLNYQGPLSMDNGSALGIIAFWPGSPGQASILGVNHKLAGGNAQILIKKNDVVIPELGALSVTANPAFTQSTGSIALAAGDYFEAFFMGGTDAENLSITLIIEVTI